MKCKCGKEAKVRGIYCLKCYKALKDYQRGIPMKPKDSKVLTFIDKFNIWSFTFITCIIILVMLLGWLEFIDGII